MTTREQYEQSRTYMFDADAPKGAGDPEVHGHYPGDPDEQYCSMCNPKPKHQTPNVYKQKHWSEEKSYTVLPAKPPREWGDNAPEDPEQNLGVDK